MTTTTSVRVELLHAPGCPNVQMTRQIVRDCLDELGVQTPIVERVGSYRSPSVLVDGVDVMSAATGDQMAGDACRLDLPTRERLLAAIQASLARRSPTTNPLTMESLCDAARDGTAARAAALPEPVRQLHRAVLHTFLATGRAPDIHQLQPVADMRKVDLAEGLRQLTENDLVHSGSRGEIVVAYPFSGRPTGHRVSSPGTPAVEAMCAIDALGIPLMTGRDAVITSTDPDTGHAVRVERTGQQWHWEPATAVVLLAQTTRCGAAAECLCPSITFHVDHEHAQAHLARHPELHGAVLNQEHALDVARLSFASLLSP